MNPIRLDDDLKLIFVFKSPQLRFLKSETDFPEFTVCEPNRHKFDSKWLKTAKTDQDFKIRNHRVVAKGFWDKTWDFSRFWAFIVFLGFWSPDEG